MHKTLFAVAVALLVQAPTASAQQSAQQTEVMSVVRQFVDGFNKGDIQSALATCAEETSIIDEIPPYAWHGPGACGKWASDFEADAKKRGITDGVVTLAATKHTYVTGDRAYVVVPADYDVKQNGKPVKQTGSTMTVVLQKGATGWKIVAWTWSTN